MTGIVYDDGNYHYYEHRKIKRSYHGTGDIYSSTLIGAYLGGHDLFKSAQLAASFVIRCIEYTIGDDIHNYGVKFEPLLVDFVNEAKS